jgi:anaerobic magnesium-protoporphyrin IX monomethyl ester cyclase
MAISAFIPLDIPRPAAGPAAPVPYLLVNPPLTDPTAAYHAIPYLVGAARAAGHRDERCVDANLEAFEFLARPRQVAATLRRARRVRERIDAAAAPSRAEEIRYRAALAAEGLTAQSVQGAVSVLRDAELFYHLPTYRHAVAVIRRWLSLLALDMPPGVMDAFSLHTQDGAVNLCSTADLADPEVIDAVSRPFGAYLDTEFGALLRDRPWRLVGFSVSYASQLPMALKMAALVRRALPRAVIVFGGTEVCDVVKYTADLGAVWKVFRDVDLIVPGEGESALVAILDAVRAGRGFEGIDGVMTPGPEPRGARIGYENVGSLPAPAYDVWDGLRYWSPEPVLLYSPTRGCYWNKCTFCDYGLNTDRPTSPSRERPLEKVVDDLAASRRYGRIVYFAVDAMSPRYLRGLCDALTKSDLDIKWGAELRLERTFPERSAGGPLAASGCVAVSFGYESGAQRILDLIDKGVALTRVPAVLRELADHGIAAQMMGFTDFPTETAREALDTYAFLHEHDDLWATAGIGRFTLTPGSIVAKQPGRFGVEVAPPPASNDIRRFLPWTGDGTRHIPMGPDARIPVRARRWLDRGAFARPFVGGIDSAHSLLYFARYGRGLLPAVDPAEPSRVVLAEDCDARITFADLGELTGADDLRDELRERYLSGTGSTAPAVARWLDRRGRARRGAADLLVLASGEVVQLPAQIDPSGQSALARAYRSLVAGGPARSAALAARGRSGPGPAQDAEAPGTA